MWWSKLLELLTGSMKRMVLFMTLLAALVGVGGCNPYDVNEILISSDDISLTVKGDPVFVFDADDCQYAYNSGRREYRAMTDDVSEFFVFRAHETLSYVGQEFTADLTYTADHKVKSLTDQVFKVEKIDEGKGLVWLWCQSRKAGLVIKVF